MNSTNGENPAADAVSGGGGLLRLCLEMRPRLKRFAIARQLNEADAEDLLQDLFIRLQDLETGPIRAPQAYLFQMVNNMIHTARRTERRRQSRDAQWLDHRADPGAAHRGTARDTGFDRADGAPDPEAMVLARDHLDRVEQALSQLPERTAAIFRLYRIEQVPQKAIAADFGISLSAVEKHLQNAYRAVIAIRASLEREPDRAHGPGIAQGDAGAARRGAFHERRD